MAEYIELTEELILAMRAGARAILNTKKYHGTIYVSDVFSDNPKETPYLKAAEILYAASEKESEDVATVRHGRWRHYPDCGVTRCSVCDWSIEECVDYNYCQNCGARMDEEE